MWTRLCFFACRGCVRVQLPRDNYVVLLPKRIFVQKVHGVDDVDPWPIMLG